MKLMTFEHRLLAHFINCPQAQREQILADAKSSNETSGVLIYWYRQLLKV